MLEERLAAGAVALGIDLDAACLPRFRQYYELLVEWNRKFNLTRITDEDEAAEKHLLDSLAPLRLPGAADWRTVADVGSGAGFPGIPLKIARPDLDVTMIEATAKKVAFIETVIASLGLTGAWAYHGRGEEYGRGPEFRERFDLVTARAVARLNVLLEYCLPLVRPGGRFVAYKGPEGGAEAREAKRVCELLGGAPASVDEFDLPGGMGRRTLVIVVKARPSPIGYPRAGAQIAKRPL